MLHLILGCAGSGKSTLLSQKIADDVTAGQRAYLLIPEQQANLSERTMLPKLPPQAGLTFTITGFSRLAREVADQCGGSAISATQRSLCPLIMWKNLRELNGLLQEYRSTTLRSDANLTTLLLQTIKELRANTVTPFALERVANKLPKDAALRPKLLDLALLYATYDNDVAEIFDGSTADEIERLALLLADHDYFKDTHFYLDSFTGFSAAEYAVLEQILRQAKEVTVTLCCDCESSVNPAFDSITDTVNRLRGICQRLHIPVEAQTLSDNRRTQSEELKHLGSSLWAFSQTTQQKSLQPEARGAITMLCCANIYAEAEATALHVLDTVHKGTAYGDIAVIVRDTQTYRGILDAAFERHGIPYYLSEKTALSDKPLSRLLLSSLRAITRGYQAEDLMAILKTGLFPVASRDLDLFELYVSTWSINGKAFCAENWNKNPDGYTADRLTERGQEMLDAANRVREALMTPLLHLAAALHEDKHLPQLCRAVYDYMQELSLSEQCATLAKAELAAGYQKEAGETIRVWDTVLELLTQISTSLPDFLLEPEEFAAALELIFSQTEIASVPSLHDSVIIGSAATMRVENVAVAFVLGLNEGEFPSAITDSGLLCDAEKQQLSELGVSLDSRSELLSSNELLYLYRAMTKPSEQLYLSTVRFALDGQAKSPSMAYQRVLALFPYLEKQQRHFDLSMVAPLPDHATNANETEVGGAQDSAAYQSPAPSPQDLSPTTIQRLFGDTLRMTQSKIQSFVQCPYSFYAQHLLSLRQRTVAHVDYADSGTFMHYILEHFLKQCLDADDHLVLPDDRAMVSMTDDIVGGYLSQVFPDEIELTTLHVFRRMHTLTLLLLRDIVEELTHSAFTPTQFELHIGGRQPGCPPPYEIPLSDGKRMTLSGKVDRVDFFRKEDALYLRVVDYKSNKKVFSLDDVKKGLNIQMLLYLFALCKPEHIQPAGVQYVGVQSNPASATRSGLLLNDEVVLQAVSDNVESKYLMGAKPSADGAWSGKALASEQELQELEQDIRATLQSIGDDIFNGRARRTPSSDACTFCVMRGSCPVAAPPKKY